ncbi:biotin transporter BioY [Haloimpatiens lingqiaonensis]|uniref:biotin transporter BioY n=1 Tax=Haloimpatiens lingqiaonensis TaxID=1380675 RepID=UPI001484DD19|nr:biotin transporter BioY [Haloimpatiens lingqiaonensis]
MKTRDITLTALFAALMVVGAYLSIPTPLVPLTFQAFFACLAGALLGAKLGALSQIIYILLGLIGIPVFQGGKAGPTTIVHPTFGYILGFAVGAYLIGKLIENRRATFKNLSIGIISGLIIMYAFGTIYFYFIMNFYMKNPMGIMKVIKVCVAPFIIKDILLSGVAAAIAKKVLPAIKK